MNTFIKKIPFLLIILYCFLIATVPEEGCDCNPFDEDNKDTNPYEPAPNVVYLTDHLPLWDCFHPAWSPNNRIYYLVGISDYGSKSYGGEIWSIKSDGSDRKLIRGGRYYRSLSISPDGNKLLSVRRVSYDNDSPMQLVIIELNNNTDKLIPTSFTIGWSIAKFFPSGDSILFHAGGGQNGFCSIHLDGSNERFLFSASIDAGFDISSDGVELAWNCSQTENCVRVRKFNETTDKKLDIPGTWLKYNPDGKRIVAVKSLSGAGAFWGGT